MISQEATSLLITYVQSLIAKCPSGWEKIIKYEEYVTDEDGYLHKLDIVHVWIDNKKWFDYHGSIDSEKNADLYHQQCVQDGNNWLAMRLQINNNGSYSTKFYYEASPLYNGDHEIVLQILADN